MKFEKYVFKKYNKKYPKMFEKEKKRLKKIFPDAEVEHIGSTAVEGLGGKGIVDISLGMKESKKSAIKKLIENKYNYIGKGSDKKERWMFERDYIYDGKVQRIHVHLTILDSKTWEKCISFREALKNDKELRNKYSKLKMMAMSKNLKDDEYKDFKSDFIGEVLNK